MEEIWEKDLIESGRYKKCKKGRFRRLSERGNVYRKISKEGKKMGEFRNFRMGEGRKEWIKSWRRREGNKRNLKDFEGKL